MQSCDVFFYQYGLKVGPEAIARYAKAFGLGASTGIDLPGEKLGLVPSPAGRRERGRVWHSGETLNIAIGQGALLVTPLQVARMTAACVRDAAIELGRHAAVDGVFVSCTSLRVAEIVEEVEAAIGKPVSSSNHAMAWHALRLAGVDDALDGWGRLFRA